MPFADSTTPPPDWAVGSSPAPPPEDPEANPRTRGEAYGMRVRGELERVTARDVAIGAVYATLDRLEAKGLVRSDRALLDGASRRLFQVTREGARALADTRAMRERLWQGVELAAVR